VLCCPRAEELVGLCCPKVSVGNYEYDYLGDSKDDPSGANKAFRPSWWNGQNDSGGECGLPCAMRFQMPGQRGNGALHGTFSGLGGNPTGLGVANGNAPFWYHFAYRSVHFVLLSGEHDLRRGSYQYEWLKVSARPWSGWGQGGLRSVLFF